MTAWQESLPHKVADRILVAKTFLLVLGCWLGLRILSFRTVRRLFAKIARPQRASPEDHPGQKDQIVWAVSKASTRLLGAGACLPQAIVAQLLLVQKGFPASLEIGVRKSEAGKLQAHAWVIVDEEIVIGGDKINLASYQPLFHFTETVT